MTRAERDLRQSQEEYRQAFRAWRAARRLNHPPDCEAALLRVRAAVARHDECNRAYVRVARRQVT